MNLLSPVNVPNFPGIHNECHGGFENGLLSRRSDPGNRVARRGRVSGGGGEHRNGK